MWAFIIIFTFTVYGGEVRATVEFKDQSSCEKAYRDIQRMGLKARFVECHPVMVDSRP